MTRNKNKIVVPEAREALNHLKLSVTNQGGSTTKENIYETAKEVGVPFKKGYNGDLTSRQAGKVGGNIGGKMVHELVKMAEQQLQQKYKK